VSEEKNELVAIVKEYDLEETKANRMLEQFSGYFQLAAEWEAKAKTIVVTDESQTGDMAMAREGRLFLREKRIAVEKTRKELKEQSLREGKAIDGIANVLKALIVPIEEHLKAQEDFVKIKQEREEAIRREEAEKLLREKEEREAREREEAERERQRKQAEEMERLRKERAEQEKALQAERKARAEAEAKAEKERKEAEAKRRAEQQEAERKAAEERARIEAEREKERQAAKRKLEQERKAAEKKIAEARAKAELAAAQVKCPKCGEVFDGREHKAQ